MTLTICIKIESQRYESLAIMHNILNTLVQSGCHSLRMTSECYDFRIFSICLTTCLFERSENLSHVLKLLHF